MFFIQNLTDIYSNLLDENNEPGYAQVTNLILQHVQHFIINAGRSYAKSDSARVFRTAGYFISQKSWHE